MVRERRVECQPAAPRREFLTQLRGVREASPEGVTSEGNLDQGFGALQA